jgi:hypothetical protein
VIAAHLEPKGLTRDTPALYTDEYVISRDEAARGSRDLRDAILKLIGIEPPIRLPAPPERKRPEAIALPCFCPTCHAPTHRRRQLISEIQRAVADYFGIESTLMTAADMRRCVAHPRQVAMYLASELTGQSIAEIGRRFGRDHTTVLYAIKAVKARAENDDQAAFDVTLLRERLAG